MADIVIRGMKMPKNGWKHIILTSDGKAYRFEDFSAGNTATRYEVVEVSPHGRLIDADELSRAALKKFFFDFVPRWMVKEAPTIIPADKDGET